MTDFSSSYDTYRNVVQEELVRSFSRYDGMDSRVIDAMKYSLLGGGKRVRAVLTLGVCDMLSGGFDVALPAAVAVEQLHCYSLIHDDMPCMDDDDMRRGKPSCHKTFGEATALLAGDALLTLSFETLCLLVEPAICRACIKELSDAAGCAGMIRGQELDLHIVEPAFGLEGLDDVDRHKTGRLLRAAVRMGALCGKATEQELAALTEYAENIGLVFQIVDDVLDETSTVEQLGKPIGSDRQNEKTTYASLLGIEKAMKAASDATVAALSLMQGTFGERAVFLTELARSLLNRRN